MKKIWLLAAVAALNLPLVAHSEIIKTAVVDEQCSGICLNWWPKLIVPDGWVFDEDFSRENNVNFITLAGDPGTVGIYAGAMPVEDQAATLDGFIADDKAHFLETNPGMAISDGPVFAAQNGEDMHSLLFDPANDANWDITAYGEETDADGNRYYLTFTLSAPTKALRDQYLPVFRSVVTGYRH